MQSPKKIDYSNHTKKKCSKYIFLNLVVHQVTSLAKSFSQDWKTSNKEKETNE